MNGRPIDSSAVRPDAAERLLARAAELDARSRAAIPVGRLREAATEAGIAAAAFDAALSELASDATATHRAPWWVRGGLFGVPDRRAAMVWYWVFPVMFVAGTVAITTLPARVGPNARLGLLGALAAWALFSMWSTSRAVRWADHPGWDALR